MIAIAFTLILSSCNRKTELYSPFNDLQDNRKPMSWGENDIVYLFCDDQDWEYIEPVIRKNLERPTFTTINETLFEVRRGDVKNLDQFFKFRNLIFYMNYDSSQPVSAYVKSILPKAKLQQVVKDKIGLFSNSNLWANDQQVLFVTGDNQRDMLLLNILQSEKIHDIFRERYYQRVARQLYLLPVYRDDVFHDYPFSIKIPTTYRLLKQEPGNHFLYAVNRSEREDDENPDKYLAVYYEPLDSSRVDQTWLENCRRRIAGKYFDGDEFREEDIRVERLNFNGLRGWKLSGRWFNKKYSIGGAFETFGFWNPHDKNAYMIDGSVFYPAGNKLTSLMELEAIARSFKGR